MRALEIRNETEKKNLHLCREIFASLSLADADDRFEVGRGGGEGVQRQKDSV